MNDDVRLLYAYTLDEQRTFPYLGRYMRGIAAETPRILSTPHGRERFVLVGVFLTYRACNHMGVSMSSTEAASLGSPHRERLEGVEAHTGHRIGSTSHYLYTFLASPLSVSC